MFYPKTTHTKTKIKEEEQAKKDALVTKNFDSESKGDFDVLCNIVFVLPREYDYVTEVTERNIMKRKS